MGQKAISQLLETDLVPLLSSLITSLTSSHQLRRKADGLLSRHHQLRFQLNHLQVGSHQSPLIAFINFVQSQESLVMLLELLTDFPKLDLDTEFLAISNIELNELFPLSLLKLVQMGGIVRALLLSLFQLFVQKNKIVTDHVPFLLPDLRL